VDDCGFIVNGELRVLHQSFWLSACIILHDENIFAIADQGIQDKEHKKQKSKELVGFG
jgi:hypothetical protein